MNRILITGATGFLGRHVVDQLLKQADASFGNCAIRLLCRSSEPPRPDDPRVEIAPGDILDRREVAAAMEGVDAVLHLAGMVTRDPAAAARLFQVHIEGTRNVCEAGLARGRPRIVFASSSGTRAVGRDPILHDEDSPYAVEIAGRWPYYLSKIYQEKLAFSYWAKHRLPVIALSPSLLLGPGDVRGSSTSDIRMYLDRRIANIPTGGLNFVDVRDAARTFVSALEGSEPGGRYLIGGHNMTIREFFFLIQWVSGVRAPLLSLPERWARRSAGMLRQSLTLLNRRFPLDDTTIEMAYRFWYIDNSRAVEELGLSPRPAEETVRDTVEYLRGSQAVAESA